MTHTEYVSTFVSAMTKLRDALQQMEHLVHYADNEGVPDGFEGVIDELRGAHWCVEAAEAAISSTIPPSIERQMLADRESTRPYQTDTE